MKIVDANRYGSKGFTCVSLTKKILEPGEWSLDPKKKKNHKCLSKFTFIVPGSDLIQRSARQ